MNAVSRSPLRSTFLAAAIVAALTLSACGGGSSGTSASPPATTASLTLTGTAAAAAAIGYAPVDVKCAGGVTLAGVVSTGANGTYTASVSGATFPCVVRVTNGGAVLHSVVAGGGVTVTANITPITELVTANVAGSGTTPDALYANFDAAAQAKITPTTVSAAVTVVKAALAGTIDLTGTDPIGGALVAANGATAANALGTQAATLTTALADAGVTVAALDTAVSTAASTTPPLLHAVATPATSCAGLRSGIYRVFDPSSASQDARYWTYRVKLDAAALTATDVEPAHPADITTFAPVSGSPCSYTYAGDYGTATLLVASGGWMVIRKPAQNGELLVAFLVPEQVVPLSQLAGMWNFIDYSGDDNDRPPLTSAHGARVLNATGSFTSQSNCWGISCGESTNANGTLTVDPAGGYDIGSGARLFAFIADDGTVALFGGDAVGGSFDISVRQTALALPATGDVNTFWDFSVGTGNFAPLPAAGSGASAVSDVTLTVTAVDAASNTFTRIRGSDSRVDTLTNNKPYAGLRIRPASTAAAATVYLPLPGVGLTFYANDSATDDFFGISINHP